MRKIRKRYAVVAYLTFKPEPIIVIRTDSKKVAMRWAERYESNNKTSDGALVLDGRAFRVIADTRKNKI